MGSSTLLPLAGIKVVEISHTVMGPTCGLILADLGAEVVKVEPPTGEPMRRARGFASVSCLSSIATSAACRLTSRTRRPGAGQGTDSAIRCADREFRPGAMDRVGLGYQDLKRDNPRLVYCALKGFLTGPYEHRPALDELVQFMSGLAT